MNQPQRRRRVLSAVAIGAAGALALSGCAGDAEGSSDGPVEITFQSWVPNIDQVVDAFNEEHDDIHVTLETITAGPDGGYAKMLSAVQAGNPADVAQVGYDSIPDFLINDALEDITDYVGDSADDFVPWQWETGVFDDRVYAVPQASGPLGQFYRKDIFDSLGLAYPTTWDEYYEAAKVIRASDPNRYIAAFAFNQAPWMIGLAQQGGANWFDTEDDAWVVDIDGDATISVAEYWQKLIDEDLVKIEADFSSEWNADIQNGNVVTWISGSWADAILRGTAPDTAGSWAVGPVPQWNAGDNVSATWAGGSASVVLKGSKNPEAAAEFVLWMNSDPASVDILTSVGAGWPAIADTSEVASLQEDPEVFAFYGGQDIWDVFAESDAAVDTSWKWPPLASTLFASLTDNVKAAVDAGTPIADAYRKTQSDVVNALEERGITVK
ncbi:sugar ABC transporter substrate-binding protein [Microbacterium sp. zg.Y625]|uniref:ABC transporter substrate-binding protein n=1 Tax=Microbacterium jiangjiandongii TaxID=3049071 RepID=UPI00214CF49F|nr:MULTISPECIES: sugar ABC transporter substrate-binding protein [unclassified Microbacterium]MCR2791629.1 sugar ABC transporter substrate-binding protein [Microbacterium sp. zg.Y625]MCR2817163.1 sugar ABC transporter substrate-binding protein [Microbacterium sp. zg.Y843]WIM24451.1 sugar ABC transporter substrate-binding protein [Microbacterium sp. zg-Y625]